MQGVNEQVLRNVATWLAAGKAVWLATIVETWGASPRPAGSLFAYCPALDATAGSLSGGCIEEDLLAELAEREPLSRPEERIYGESPEEQARLQLPCGGRLAIVLETLQGSDAQAHFSELNQLLVSRQRAQRHLCLHSGVAQLITPATVTRHAVERDADTLIVSLGSGERLLIVGAGEVSAYLFELAQSLDFAVTICEPRQSHYQRWLREHPGSDSRQCLPDDLVHCEFSDPYCAIVALAHDPRVDDLALLAALKSSAFYVGAMGSQRTSDNRRERLLSLGIGEDALTRLDAPIGMEIGSKTPPEIAVAIAAQLIRARATLISVEHTEIEGSGCLVSR